MTRWNADTGSLDFETVQAAYQTGTATPEDVVHAVYARIARRGDDKVWIDLLPESEAQARARDLPAHASADLPLYGLPCAIKDNIDLAKHPTTAACPAFAYTPEQSATAVERLIAAGAIPIGKTNLDQFATGLLGTLSPYGAPSSAFDAAYISGGSSSGSAVAVAAGLVSFALGTDTAGSGRVPAAFNNIVGLKPTRGLISTAGVVPACRSLDCVSVFALSCDDAWAVFLALQGTDRRDPFSRPPPMPTPRLSLPPVFRFGVPGDAQLQFYGDSEAERLYRAAVERCERLGGQCVAIDYAPFAAAAALLYDGPWIAERLVATAELMRRHPGAMLEVTQQVIRRGEGYTAADAFAAQYQLADLRARLAPLWRSIDFLLLPTAPTTFRRDAAARDPLGCNSALGTYTNFVNLLDLAAIAVPAGIDTRGLPFGVTLIGPAFADAKLCACADELHRSAGVALGATTHTLPPPRLRSTRPHGLAVAVVGAHLSGMPLNHELTAVGATFLQATRTMPRYRLYALAGTTPPKPGLVRVGERGAAIEVEVWDMPTEQVGGFLARVTSPLGLGKIEIEDGRWVAGFICEPWGVDGAVDITRYGGWRAYRAQA